MEGGGGGCRLLFNPCLLPFKVPSGRIKFRVLKTSVQDKKEKESDVQNSVLRMTDVMVPEKPKFKGKACGQCEAKSALLMCLECGEDYCPTCFVKIHQKGALKLHRTKPIEGKAQGGKFEVLHKTKRELDIKESKGFDTDKSYTGVPASSGRINVEDQGFSISTSEQVPANNASLLYGAFNEEESAKSFKDAIIQWRRETQGNLQALPSFETTTDCTGNSEAQTVLAMNTKPLEVEFKENSISYMEKLILKKNRRTPVSRASSQRQDKCRYSPTSASEHEINESDDLTAEELEDHEQYVALFKPERHDTSSIVNNPALQIVELNKAPEEELEESRSFLVSEVDNEVISKQSFPDKENQSSSLFHAKMAETSPLHNVAKKSPMQLQSSYMVNRGITFNPLPDTKILLAESIKVPQIEDNKSISYESFYDIRHSNISSSGSVSKELKSISLRQKSVVNDYEGLKGFFILDVDAKEVKPDHSSLQCSEPQIPEQQIPEQEIMCAGDSPWFPASSLGQCADEAIVKDLVENSKLQCTSFSPEHTPRPSKPKTTQRPVTGCHSKRAHSARSSESDRVLRTRSAAARPVSRAASEISEIESIDLTERDDPLQELVEEQKMLSDLGKELNILKNYSGKDLCHQVNSQESLKFKRSSRSPTNFSKMYEKKVQAITYSSPMHARRSVESPYDEESYSDGYDDALQDKLNVLSLQ
ncbi:hypothetical protein GDO86_010117 [Hymenochirus boettgeri]|uniref:B box-type domain-containing protein n=1 Tax=Hymenochirus boettgeri TaxID=247094 RepID=A0A8T2JP16_9PIPI|nr:hypothetical protein GDO86_010117 [Hymenochirus boettgeri]